MPTCYFALFRARRLFYFCYQGRRVRCAHACPWLPYFRAFGAPANLVACRGCHIAAPLGLRSRGGPTDRCAHAIICAHTGLRGQFYGVTRFYVAIIVADQHLCLSAPVWNSALFQTQLGAAMGSRDRCGLSSGRRVLFPCTIILLCRNA